jgi:hypothetical protein
MREQPAQIQNVFIGPVELFIDCLSGDRQHDSHCHGWLWNRYLQDAKLRAAAAREEGLRIIAARNARNEVAYQEAAE